MVTTSESAQRFRALFISDVHLGTRGCQAEQFLDFLRHHDADIIYLVGDIVDGWQLRSSWYWPSTHNDVVQKLLRKARKGGRLVYIPGNHIHHAAIRDFDGVRYINCGDSVESCSAVVEHPDGRFEIVSWVRDAQRIGRRPERAEAKAA